MYVRTYDNRQNDVILSAKLVGAFFVCEKAHFDCLQHKKNEECSDNDLEKRIILKCLRRLEIIVSVETIRTQQRQRPDQTGEE